MALFTEFNSKLASFKLFLKAAGAEVLVTTNEWEVLRFRTGSNTSMVYRKASGVLTFTGEAEKAWQCFKSQARWRPVLATADGMRAARPKKATPLFRTLQERDGDLCFFCWKAITEADCSIEHLVCVSQGGPSHLSNLFLAHRVCNSRAGNLSAPEKIKIHVTAALKLNEKHVRRDVGRERLARSETGGYTTTESGA